jgi:hypothetical protein
LVNEFWFHIRLRGALQPLIVLDVSQAAQGSWPVFHSTVEALAEELPVTHQPEVVFLGSAERLPLRTFLAQADSLWSSNRGRGRVISPLLDSLEQRWPSRVVVLAAKALHDLDDWATHPNAGRLKLFSTSPFTACLPVQLLSDVSGVCLALSAGPPSIRISATSAIPFAWDQPEYYLAAATVRCQSETGRDVRVGFLSSVEKLQAKAELLLDDGSADPLGVKPCDAPEANAWSLLTAAELTILEAWRGRASFPCKHCSAAHPPGEICSVSKLFPSLRTIPIGGYAVLRLQMFQAMFQPVSCSAYKLAPDQVIHRSPSVPEPQLARLVDDVWTFTDERPGWFIQLDSPDRFLLALPYVPERS